MCKRSCSLCRIETELLGELRRPDRQESYRLLLSSAPELAGFSGVDALLAHLRLCREITSSDGIHRALLRARQASAHGVVEALFVLAFLPHMHALLRNVAWRYPELSQEDATQQLLETLLHLLDSPHLAARQAYFGFAIARRLKRALFEWAEREIRLSRHADASRDIENIPVWESNGSSFERVALLHHFLDGARRRGFLSENELDLLIQFKGENGRDKASSAHSSNAHRQRWKRLLSKLRRLAASGPG
jgi:hypothetical protein